MPTDPQMTGAAAELEKWLNANGIDEYLPVGLKIVVSRRGKTIHYTSYVWADGERGYDAEKIELDGDNPLVEWRTVPLVEPKITGLVTLAAMSGASFRAED